MKIGILGNMNNNAVNLAYYITNAGYECELLLYPNESSYFLPDSDGYEDMPFCVRTLAWGSYADLWLTSGRKILGDLEDFDFLIGSRLSPSFMHKASLKLDIFMPTGGDIWTVPVFAGWTYKNLLKYLFVSRRQRAGIRESKAIFFDKTNDETEKIIADVIDGVPRYEHPVPCLYYPEFDGERLQDRTADSTLYKRFQKIRSESDVFLVHHVKHLWRQNSVAKFDVLQEKGNDRLLYALRLFKERNPGVSIKILMCEYGMDFRATQDLAKELGVADCLEWVPVTPRKDLMLAIQLCDAVVGELARSWYSYGVVLEAMTMSKPIIHNRDDSYFSGRELYPMLNASCLNTVADAIEFVFRNPSEARDIGRRSGIWMREVAIGKSIQDIVRLIEEKRVNSNGD